MVQDGPLAAARGVSPAPAGRYSGHARCTPDLQRRIPMNRKTTSTLRLSKETIRSLTPEQMSMLHGGATNDNGTQRCSRIYSCLSWPGCTISGGPDCNPE